MPNQHVVKRENGWAVRSENGSRDTSHHQTQEAAFEAARKIAKNQKSEDFLHGRDGKIRDRNTYGDDPYPPSG